MSSLMPFAEITASQEVRFSSTVGCLGSLGSADIDVDI